MVDLEIYVDLLRFTRDFMVIPFHENSFRRKIYDQATSFLNSWANTKRQTQTYPNQ